MGVPILFLHGGPGSGITALHRRFFDPNFYRIILFDQRGAGKSRPIAEYRENTTEDLISDIEKLRKYLKIDKWAIFGGSWGSTLGLAYGQRYAERCLGFILRGIFLGRASEIDWFMTGMKNFFPEAHRAMLAPLSEAERCDPLAAYWARLSHPDPTVHYPAAAAWSTYETACSTLKGEDPKKAFLPSPDEMLAVARLEAHYFMNQNFLNPNALLNGLDKITNKPAVIIQGRYDVICPIRSADELVQAWPGSEYVVIPDAGHSALEPGIMSALVQATEKMKDKFL